MSAASVCVPRTKHELARTDERDGSGTGIAAVTAPTPADAAIAAVTAGKAVECNPKAYRRDVRQALQGQALRLNDADQTERCRAVLDEIRRLDELHAYNA